MAAVLEPKDAAAKYESQVDEQIAQATSRIRAHDLTFGGLVLVALVLVYATAMIVLDKYLALPEWVRQLSLAGFVAIARRRSRTSRSSARSASASTRCTRPSRSSGPSTTPKNSVTGYVDAQREGRLNATVKAALASRAAKSVARSRREQGRRSPQSALRSAASRSRSCSRWSCCSSCSARRSSRSLMGRTFVPFSSDRHRQPARNSRS